MLACHRSSRHRAPERPEQRPPPLASRTPEAVTCPVRYNELLLAMTPARSRSAATIDHPLRASSVTSSALCFIGPVGALLPRACSNVATPPMSPRLRRRHGASPPDLVVTACMPPMAEPELGGRGGERTSALASARDSAAHVPPTPPSPVGARSSRLPNPIRRRRR